MGKKYEIDSENEVLTDLQLGFTGEYESIGGTDEQIQLKYTTLEYFQQLKEEGRIISVHFTGLRGSVLFAVYGDLELNYSLSSQYFGRVDREHSLSVLDRDYQLTVREVMFPEKKVILQATSQTSMNRKKALAIINEKLLEKEPIYLRGQIISLQYNSGKNKPGNAVYVNIEGLGILGIIPISRWSTGYTGEGFFQEIIRKHVGSMVNFMVTGKTWLPDGRRAFVLSRRGYLERVGYNPWNIVSKTLRVKSTVIVRIVEDGKSEGSMFGAIDGIGDLNMLCYPADESGLKLQDMHVGKYYYGYIQKLDVEKKFMRVRLTALAKQGNELQEVKNDVQEECVNNGDE